ncbi:Cupin 2, conserved barrel [Penicillium expansum]|uniref:Cupin 2, conserved barrel n=1 Tax=Penicillium expansum TaxID=27334 RepID=A0A0A2KB20_PENEN|nr:Cupin 2, conserved barrel [Penicillium expansum]KGO43992.1 Cupin 2, conserved barrel [Penicillium expansum]KGO52459.1 Cupin 2, conserved barrel [Penicillium expansum]KGO61550.1 Cupin 2, conserved barrel [Penicillium expansum]
MAPCKPRTFTAGQDPLTKFDGAISVRNLPRPTDRFFLFHGIMRPSRGIYAKLIATGQKPPTHFHPSQWEFFRVLRGNLTIEFNGELAVPPYTHHVIYGTPGTEMNEVEFIVSASDPAAEEEGATMMDQPFFENWYGYQEDVFQRGEKLDFVQVLSMFEAGGTYLSPPWPVDRWAAGFYPEWTTDWEAACELMQQSRFQRRFADPQAQQRAQERFRGQLGEEASAKGEKSE